MVYMELLVNMYIYVYISQHYLLVSASSSLYLCVYVYSRCMSTYVGGANSPLYVTIAWISTIWLLLG